MPTQKQKDERIRITLPRDPLNPDEKVERVIINGACTTIQYRIVYNKNCTIYYNSTSHTKNHY